jgi:hypothetical protein
VAKMKKLALLLLLSVNTVVFTQEYERNVLFEMFTNSHCPLCTSAHASFESYLANGVNAGNLNYIFYHMVFPYSDDPVYQANPSDAAGRNNYYGPYSSTPVAFFDGEKQPNNYSQWTGNIDSRFSVTSPVLIELSGTVEGDVVTLDADITFGSNVPTGAAVIHFVVTESINYAGRNGVSDHKNVMRKMITGPTGETISTSGNRVVSKSFQLNGSWNPDKIEIVVFIQNSNSREIYQSASISYGSLIPTSISNESSTPVEFSLEQNYPNPFNPSTTINYSIPDVETGHAPSHQNNGGSLPVTLIVYDILGREVATLVNEYMAAGNYSAVFNADALSSGIYFYTLKTGRQVLTRKMTLLK